VTSLVYDSEGGLLSSRKEADEARGGQLSNGEIRALLFYPDADAWGISASLTRLLFRPVAGRLNVFP